MKQSLYDIRLTKEECDYLISAGGFRARKILSRATKIDPEHPENKEILTNEKINHLFGAKPYMLYYNFDTEKWNTEYFMGKQRTGILHDTADVKRMKSILENKLNFIDTEIVAVVIITCMEYPGWGNLTRTKNTNISLKNNAIGALVCRNKKTGQIIPQPAKHIGIAHYLTPDDVTRYAVHAFSRDATADVCDSKFARTLNNLYKRQR
ncbi:MAG: hypothetical protein IJY99_00765 [Alphaproteobacteria bacterium]|nr:hypothetical protein [Alphaproteobacteria bacterium]